MPRTTTHRSDIDIFGAARVALDQDPGVPQDVRVHVDGGVVTLTGTVRRPAERSRAEQVVRGIEGVRELVNKIAVAQVANVADFEPPDEPGTP